MRIALRIALAASAALLTLGVAQAQEKTLRIGTEGAYPPFNNLTSDGQLVGLRRGARGGDRGRVRTARVGKRSGLVEAVRLREARHLDRAQVRCWKLFAGDPLGFTVIVRSPLGAAMPSAMKM